MGDGGSLKYETASETTQKGIELFSIKIGTPLLFGARCG